MTSAERRELSATLLALRAALLAHDLPEDGLMRVTGYVAATLQGIASEPSDTARLVWHRQTVERYVSDQRA
jgi:hypothetical protein